jgi:hypothetical protein
MFIFCLEIIPQLKFAQSSQLRTHAIVARDAGRFGLRLVLCLSLGRFGAVLLGDGLARVGVHIGLELLAAIEVFIDDIETRNVEDLVEKGQESEGAYLSRNALDGNLLLREGLDLEGKQFEVEVLIIGLDCKYLRLRAAELEHLADILAGDLDNEDQIGQVGRANDELINLH